MIEKLLKKLGYVPASQLDYAINRHRDELEQLTKQHQTTVALLKDSSRRKDEIINGNLAELARTWGKFARVTAVPIQTGYEVSVVIDIQAVYRSMDEIDRCGDSYTMAMLVHGLHIKIERDLEALLKLKATPWQPIW